MPVGIREEGQLKRRILYVASPLLVLALWELVARAGMIDVRFFPPPTKIFQAMIDMAGRTDPLTGKIELWQHLGASLSRIFWGSLLGFIPAVIIGLLMGLSPTLRAFLNPLVSVTYPIPKIAILPLLLLIFGLGEMSKIVVLAIGIFFLGLINTLQGVLQIPQIYFEVGHVYRVGWWRQFFLIVLPGAFPSIFTGLRLGVGYGLVLIVAAEFVGAKTGIGYLIWQSWEAFLVEDMYVGLILISLLGYLFNIFLERLEARFVPWSGK